MLRDEQTGQLLPWPALAEVVEELAEYRNYLKRQQGPMDAESDGSADVRLQVYPDSSWYVRKGLSDYDQDHKGFWGASSIGPDSNDLQLLDVARDLIGQAKEHEAQCC
jgi:hypothetical protein